MNINIEKLFKDKSIETIFGIMNLEIVTENENKYCFCWIANQKKSVGSGFNPDINEAIKECFKNSYLNYEKNFFK